MRLLFCSCIYTLFLFLHPATGQIAFTESAAERGFTYYALVSRVGGGISFCDFDDDGDDDITLATEAGSFLAFFENTNGSFQRIAPLVPHRDDAKQVLWVDYDNDGDKDLFVTTFDGPNRLYERIAGGESRM